VASPMKVGNCCSTTGGYHQGRDSVNHLSKALRDCLLMNGSNDVGKTRRGRARCGAVPSSVRFLNFCLSRLAHDGTRDHACFIHTDKEHII